MRFADIYMIGCGTQFLNNNQKKVKVSQEHAIAVRFYINGFSALIQITRRHPLPYT